MIGQTIKAIRDQTDEEMAAEGWDTPAVVIELSNGALIFPSGDEEGNHPGDLFTRINGEAGYLLPTMKIGAKE